MDQIGQAFHDLLSRVQSLFAHFSELKGIPFTGQARELESEIRQAVDIAPRSPGMALAQLRKVLEQVLRQVYLCRTREQAGTRPLENLLQRLVKDGHLSEPEATFADAVKGLGNFGAHKFGATPSHVVQSLSQLVPVLEWYCEQDDLEVVPAADSPRRNPYDPLSPAAAEIFVGRAELTRRLTSGLQGGLSYRLDGDPGIGKTSLLLAVERELLAAQARPAPGARPLPLFMDCDPGRYGSLDLFLVALTKGLAKQLKDQRGLTCPPEQQDLALAEAKKKRLEAALKLLLNWAFGQEKEGHAPVLFLDDYHRLDVRPWLMDLDSVLEAAVNRHLLTLVLTWNRPVSQKGRHDVPGLHQLLQPCSLGPLTREETNALVDLARSHGWDVEKGCADKAYELTGGRPLELQRLLHTLLSSMNKLTVSGLTALRVRTST